MTDLQAILKKVWGYDSFRPLQREIIESVLGGKDTIALLPTGAGKSMTYQVPALACDGLAIVVTPLISLMYDQVEALRSKEVIAAYINSTMSYSDIDRVLDNCIYGDVKLLYVAPERIDTQIFQARVPKMNVSLVAIDEAHCISQWGYDFRPSYFKIAQLRELLPSVPFLALTATATNMVVEDISARLGMTGANIFRASFERTNIRFVVRETADKLEKILQIAEHLDRDVGIVYCRTRKGTVLVSNYLNENGISADFYHAGLDSKTRAAKQNGWMSETVRIMVATSAFGMGIDKPNVRFVIHYDMPDTVEEYYQQAGRAGRDGKESFAVALYSSLDIPVISRRVDEEFPSTDTVRQVYDKLCRYLQIAYEYGEGVTRKFSLIEFSKMCGMFSTKVVSALKILQSNGYITYFEEHERLTRVMFRIRHEDLYRYQIDDRYDVAVVETMLRNYTGMFSQLTAVSEDFIAGKCDISPEEVSAVLLRLSRMKVITYVPRSSEPMVRLETDRVPVDYLRIAPETYIVRRNNLRLMIEFVKDYLTERERCRMQVLCEYFDQKDVCPCGHCDVCGAQKVSGSKMSDITVSDENEIDRTVLGILSESDQTISENSLLEKTGYRRGQILLSLRRLLWKNLVYEMPDGRLKIIADV